MKKTTEVDIDSYSTDQEECDKMYGEGAWESFNKLFLAMKSAKIDKVFITIDDKGGKARIY